MFLTLRTFFLKKIYSFKLLKFCEKSIFYNNLVKKCIFFKFLASPLIQSRSSGNGYHFRKLDIRLQWPEQTEFENHWNLYDEKKIRCLAIEILYTWHFVNLTQSILQHRMRSFFAYYRFWTRGIQIKSSFWLKHAKNLTAHESVRPIQSTLVTYYEPTVLVRQSNR